MRMRETNGGSGVVMVVILVYKFCQEFNVSFWLFVVWLGVRNNDVDYASYYVDVAHNYMYRSS